MNLYLNVSREREPSAFTAEVMAAGFVIGNP
jgi:hypothetical protein